MGAAGWKMRAIEDMSTESQAIEVEVVAVDGIVPAARPARREESARPETGGGASWRGLQGRVLKLDSRWWPLWVFLGILGVLLLLTFGLVIGVLFVVFQVVRKIFRAIFG